MNPPRDPADHVRIEAGTPEDLRVLERFHYRPGRPATLELVLRAVCGGLLAGVLGVSRPALNGAWRELAWPGSYGGPSRRANARRLNEDVRTISRVIVDPRARGTGIASGLVRAYLDRPLTRRTEALASMARVCPLFERAGMRRVEVPPVRRDARLDHELRRLGIERAELADVDLASALLARLPSLAPALRAWANDARGTRPLARDRASRARVAVLCAAERPVAFVHDARGDA